MKVLHIVRHAKSDWDNPELDDFERPLNARGKRDAPAVAKEVRTKGIKPDVMISSSALRAITTARVFAQELGVPLASMVVTNALYEVSLHEALSYIEALPPAATSVMMFGHNPTWTTLVNKLASTPMGEMPTCAVVTLVFPDATTWAEVAHGKGVLQSVDQPKR